MLAVQVAMTASTHGNGSKIRRSNQKHQCRQTSSVIYASAITMVVALTLEASTARCEGKEFDWGELGVQLANAKPSLSGQPASNLRILVSPQRRISKNYEFEFTNSSGQTQPSQSDAGSYMLSSSSGNPYLSQSVYQLSPNHTIHSSAYSALSASLASLKSRLNARGVSLSSALGENGSQPTTGHLYSAQNAYGSSVLLDPNQQVQQQAQQQVGQAPSQPTYLSVSSQQEQQSGAAYTVPPSQSNDNKTIVLAIPAKINFLSGAKQQSQQHLQQQAHTSQHQAQQLSVLQSGGEQQARPEYATKQQLGVLSPDGSLDNPAQAGNEQQEHHQYVIVNQPPMVSGDHHSHSVAANLSPSAVSTNSQVYSTILQTAPSSSGQVGGYTVKYIPAYTSQLQQQQQQQHQAPQPAAIQKVYSVIEPQPLTGGQQMQSVLPQVQASYEPQLVEYPALGTRYLSCLDTCNSADPRWRKYTVSKYKACCSRSAQYDAAFEQPSAEKVGETAGRYSEDAYYNYLYRRSRARRARRMRMGRNHYGSSSGRYYGNSGSPLAGSPTPLDEESQVQEHQANENGATRTSSSSGRSAYYSQEYPYAKQQYRAGRGGHGSVAPVSGASSIQDSMDSGSRDEPAASKYATTKERTYKRGRSRELEPIGEPQSANDNVEDDSIYPPPRPLVGGSVSSSGYGNNDYSVDAQGRYPASEAGRGGLASEEDDQTRFDEPTEMESASGKSDEYSADGFESSASEDGEPDGLSLAQAYKYPGSNRRKKSQVKSRQQRRPPAGGKDLPKHYKKSRKNKYGKSNGEQQQSGNGTDYESAQSNEYQQEQANGFNGEQDDQSSYSSKSNQSPYEQSESDKEAILAKYRASLNDTTVANLSKTTMHLKEILSILEKKAHLRSNETAGQQAPVAPQSAQSQQQTLPVTSTPAPATTTTTLYPPLSSLLSSSSYSSPLSSDFLASDFGLKSPYRFEPSSLTSSLGSAPISLPSSFGSFGSGDVMSPLTPPYPPHYGVQPSKHLGAPSGPQRKRRPSKNGRYNDIMFQKAAHSLMNQPSLLHAASKNRFLNPAYYSALHYPYLYRGTGPTITNPYPYKNIHKTPYSSLLNGPSKLAASSQLYTDESRLHSLGLDPLANMASSLRPSSTLRLRNKPFVFQPQVVPIYTRHTILSPSLDVKA